MLDAGLVVLLLLHRLGLMNASRSSPSLQWPHGGYSLLSGGHSQISPVLSIYIFAVADTWSQIVEYSESQMSRLLAVLLISASFCTTPPEPLHRILAIFYIQVTTHVFMLSINVTLRSCGPPSEYLILKRLNLLGKVGRLSREMTSRSQSRQRSS
jgi:hypothetical protein